MLFLYLAIAFLCAGLISVIIALVGVILDKHEKILWALCAALISMALAIIMVLLYNTKLLLLL